MKIRLRLFTTFILLSVNLSIGQVPSYVPTNGLVGYWPFNGNANDESGSGNNGTVNGASLITDRYGNSDKAYSFAGNQNITIQNSSSLIFANARISISYWFKIDNYYGTQGHIAKSDPFGPIENGWNIIMPNNNAQLIDFQVNYPNSFAITTNHGIPSDWIHLVITLENGYYKAYKNGILVGSQYISSMASATISNTYPLYFGVDRDLSSYFRGKLDDIGIWNRALTQQEITNLYNSVSSNECLTMTINTGVLNTNPITYTNTVNIYPNPTNDQITIDCGNLANVQGWNIKITNMLGQEVFNQPMNTQQYVVPLNTWTGQGMYFVKIINAQNEVVNIKKIILQ